MKAKLEFDLDNPDDKEQFVVASTAQDWYMALYDLDQQLRTYLKYGHDFKSADDALEDLREKLWEFMEDYNVNFNMLS
jgi:hypothetical protein